MSGGSKRAEPKEPKVETALCVDRIDRGESVDQEALPARHSPIPEQLRSFIVAEVDLRTLAAPEPHADKLHRTTHSTVAGGEEILTAAAASPSGTKVQHSELGDRFWKYRIIQPLEEVAMGTVYPGADTYIGRQVALKTHHFADNLAGLKCKCLPRIARATATLRNSDIVPPHALTAIDEARRRVDNDSIGAGNTFIRPIVDVQRRPGATRQLKEVNRNRASAETSDRPHSRQLRPLIRTKPPHKASLFQVLTC